MLASILGADGRRDEDRCWLKRYSLPLVDLDMPVMTGIELLTTIGRVVRRPPMIIVITAHARQYLRELDERLVNIIVRKPFDAEQLSEVVAASLRAITDRNNTPQQL